MGCITNLIPESQTVECQCSFPLGNLSYYMVTVSREEMLRFKNGEGIRYLVEYQYDFWHMTLDYVYKMFEYIGRADGFNIALIVILSLLMLVLPLFLLIKDCIDRKEIETTIQMDKDQREYLALFREIQNVTITKRRPYSITSVYKRALLIFECREKFFNELQLTQTKLRYTSILGTLFTNCHPVLNIFNYYDHTLNRPVRSLTLGFKFALIALMCVFCWHKKSEIVNQIDVIGADIFSISSPPELVSNQTFSLNSTEMTLNSN